METLLAGKWEMDIGTATVIADFLGDLVPNYEEGTRETTTQGGVRTQPSGVPATAEFTGTMYVSSMDDLKVLFADIYNAPTGYEYGNFVFGSNTCQTRMPVVVNLHQVCDEDSRNDIHIFAGLVAFNFNPTLNSEEAFSVEFTIYMQPTEDGYMQVGSGSLTEGVLWDATTQDWVPVGS